MENKQYYEQLECLVKDVLITYEDHWDIGEGDPVFIEKMKRLTTLLSTSTNTPIKFAAGPWVRVSEKPPEVGVTYLCQAGPIVGLMIFQGGKWHYKTVDRTVATDWNVTWYAEIYENEWWPGTEGSS